MMYLCMLSALRVFFFLSTRDERIPNTVGQMAGVCCSQRLLKAQSFTVAAADFIQPDKQTLKNKRGEKKFLSP